MLREFYQVVEYNFASKNKRIIYEFDTMLEALRYVNGLSQDFVKCSYHIMINKKIDFKKVLFGIMFLLCLIYLAR